MKSLHAMHDNNLLAAQGPMAPLAVIFVQVGTNTHGAFLDCRLDSLDKACVVWPSEIPHEVRCMVLAYMSETYLSGNPRSMRIETSPMPPEP